MEKQVSFEKRYDLIFMFIKKYLFPDFSNKLTWLLTTTGIGIILTPSPIKVAIFNYAIKILTLNSITPLILNDFQNSTTDKVIAFLLIVLGLAHNLIYRYITFLDLQKSYYKNISKRDADVKLFKKFLKE
ncbi:MAG: hypothetical protein MI702_13700, partial [Chlorobiales bacterium]|nr:hypothetical protein [Chlorobiales bacterium]